MERVVERELLDDLPFDDPEALRSRRDLTLLNALMGNHRSLEAAAMRVFRPGARLLELGAGHGQLSARLRRSPKLNVAVEALDLAPPPKDWPPDTPWHQADVTAFSDFHRFDGIVANLLLHQFSDGQLATMGKRMGEGPRAILAAEPTRRRRHLLQLQALGFALGRVTRHDAAVSVRAGFCGEELPRLLGLDPDIWRWTCRESVFGQYLMLAERID